MCGVSQTVREALFLEAEVVVWALAIDARPDCFRLVDGVGYNTEYLPMLCIKRPKHVS